MALISGIAKTVAGLRSGVRRVVAGLKVGVPDTTACSSRCCATGCRTFYRFDLCTTAQSSHCPTADPPHIYICHTTTCTGSPSVSINGRTIVYNGDCYAQLGFYVGQKFHLTGGEVTGSIPIPTSDASPQVSAASVDCYLTCEACCDEHQLYQRVRPCSYGSDACKQTKPVAYIPVGQLDSDGHEINTTDTYSTPDIYSGWCWKLIAGADRYRRVDIPAAAEVAPPGTTVTKRTGCSDPACPTGTKNYIHAIACDGSESTVYICAQIVSEQPIAIKQVGDQCVRVRATDPLVAVSDIPGGSTIVDSATELLPSHGCCECSGCFSVNNLRHIEFDGVTTTTPYNGVTCCCGRQAFVDAVTGPDCNVCVVSFHQRRYDPDTLEEETTDLVTGGCNYINGEIVLTFRYRLVDADGTVITDYTYYNTWNLGCAASLYPWFYLMVSYDTLEHVTTCSGEVFRSSKTAAFPGDYSYEQWWQTTCSCTPVAPCTDDIIDGGPGLLSMLRGSGCGGCGSGGDALAPASKEVVDLLLQAYS